MTGVQTCALPIFPVLMSTNLWHSHDNNIYEFFWKTIYSFLCHFFVCPSLLITQWNTIPTPEIFANLTGQILRGCPYYLLYDTSTFPFLHSRLAWTFNICTMIVYIVEDVNLQIFGCAYWISSYSPRTSIHWTTHIYSLWRVLFEFVLKSTYQWYRI